MGQSTATAEQLGPLRSYPLCVPGAAVIAETRALIASADCTVNITDPNGNDIDNVPLNRGVNPICCIKVRAVSTGSVFLGR